MNILPFIDKYVRVRIRMRVRVMFRLTDNNNNNNLLVKPKDIMNTKVTKLMPRCQAN